MSSKISSGAGRCQAASLAPPSRAGTIGHPASGSAESASTVVVGNPLEPEPRAGPVRRGRCPGSGGGRRSLDDALDRVGRHAQVERDDDRAAHASPRSRRREAPGVEGDQVRIRSPGSRPRARSRHAAIRAAVELAVGPVHRRRRRRGGGPSACRSPFRATASSSRSSSVAGARGLTVRPPTPRDGRRRPALPMSPGEMLHQTPAHSHGWRGRRPVRPEARRARPGAPGPVRGRARSTIATHDAFTVLALAVGLAIYYRELRRRRWLDGPIVWISLAAVLGGAIGARLITAWEHRRALRRLADRPLSEVIEHSGKSILGAIVGGYLAIALAKRAFRLHALDRRCLHARDPGRDGRSGGSAASSPSCRSGRRRACRGGSRQPGGRRRVRPVPGLRVPMHPIDALRDRASTSSRSRSSCATATGCRLRATR